jgi:hypothetical protein
VQSGASKLSVNAGNTPDKQKLVWRWKQGEATDADDFGAGIASRGYSLCLYDGGDVLLMSTKAPTTGTCGGAPCWSSKNGKFQYKDTKLTRTGTRKAQLKSGDTGKASIKVQGKGLNLGVPPLPVAQLPLTVQLINHEGDCWGAMFSVANTNDASKLKATSD